jgi:hypothetical protein
MTDFKIMPLPQPVGYWVLYLGAPMCTKFAMYARPTEQQIAATCELLGWGWEDCRPIDAAKENDRG